MLHEVKYTIRIIAINSSGEPMNTLVTNTPNILNILLIDRTMTSSRRIRNIIWANDNYIEQDATLYAPTAQIKSQLIMGDYCNLIRSRAQKAASVQKQRTKTNAEVFTPVRIIEMQNNAVETEYLADDLEIYTKRKWLEITCGEAPYMTSRYDMVSGENIPISERVGFVDRKLARISKEVSDKAEWQRLVELAYKSSYGFEWNGDSLFIARENLLLTYNDYYFDKWNEYPTHGLLEEIAVIISFNVFQMDGLTCTIPLSESREPVQQLSLFTINTPEIMEWEITPGKRVRIMNWDTNKMEFFDKGTNVR